MAEFVIAFVVFIASHVVPARTGLRDYLIGRLGRRIYLLLYSAVSILLLLWLIWAAAKAPHIGLWPTTGPTVVIVMVIMAVAAVLLACGASRANPFSISFVGGPADLERPGILALTRHPVLWALFLWALGHAITNGDLVGVVMFGAFALFCLISRPVLERRARQQMSPAEFDRQVAVNCGPVMLRLRRALSVRFILELGTGLVLYALMLHFHGVLIGVDPMAYF
ncbi:NnrU family protein [Hoeflea sp. TYP-13]|uniref:NnrU family protein n=1 Tax=Hoeflea sp. TYP-13 TaxID=3230023 RepID=UPI0034C6322F